MTDIKLYLKIARFDHWIKQLFIVPGIIIAVLLIEEIDYSTIATKTILGWLATCFIASANYIINEWLDADFDKFHPTKKHRPVVAGNLKASYIIIEYILFGLVGLTIAWFASLPLFLSALLLFVMGIVYNVRPLRSKEIAYLDVVSESFNNAIRLLIGWFIVTSDYLPPVSILLGYWMGGAFLMAAKRFAEYRMIGDKTQAALYRKSFKYYSEKTLLISAFFYALLSVFFCGIFMIKYKIELLIAIPFLCGLFCIYLNLCYKYDSSAQKPEKLFKEKKLMLYVLFFIVLLGVIAFLQAPFLQKLLETSLLKF